MRVAFRNLLAVLFFIILNVFNVCGVCLILCVCELFISDLFIMCLCGVYDFLCCSIITS